MADTVGVRVGDGVREGVRDGVGGTHDTSVTLPAVPLKRGREPDVTLNAEKETKGATYDDPPPPLVPAQFAPLAPPPPPK